MASTRRPSALPLAGLLLLITLVSAGQLFDRVFIIVFENQAYENVIMDPAFNSWSNKGHSLLNFYATTHPSQPNYISMVAGDTLGVTSNDPYNLNASHIGDLLEAKGFTWKSYQEDYPGNCDLSPIIGLYARKHNPFASFLNVQKNPDRCRRVMVPSSQLDADLASGNLPTYSFYTPNLDNDGHDTSIEHAGVYLNAFLGPRLAKFPNRTLIVITWDEDDKEHKNRIYTVLLGDMIAPGTFDSTQYTFYSLLRSIEENFDLGSLNTNDAAAFTIAALDTRNKTAPRPPSPLPPQPRTDYGSPSLTTTIIILGVVILVVVGVTVLSLIYRERMRFYFNSLFNRGRSSQPTSFSTVGSAGGNERLFDEDELELNIDLDEDEDLK